MSILIIALLVVVGVAIAIALVKLVFGLIALVVGAVLAVYIWRKVTGGSNKAITS